MNPDKVKVDSATDASPPHSLRKDAGCSPLRFLSSTQPATRIGRDIGPSFIVIYQKEQNKKEKDSTNK